MWNWKSAVLSVMLRTPIFVAAAWQAGLLAAATAAAADVAFRVIAAGLIGAAVQRLASRPPTMAVTLGAVVGIPAAVHTSEAIVHSVAGTPAWRQGVMVSIAVSVVTTAFNLYAMRRDALRAGEGRPLREDLRRLPRLIAGFVSLPFSSERPK